MLRVYLEMLFFNCLFNNTYIMALQMVFENASHIATKSYGEESFGWKPRVSRTIYTAKGSQQIRKARTVASNIVTSFSCRWSLLCSFILLWLIVYPCGRMPGSSDRRELRNYLRNSDGLGIWRSYISKIECFYWIWISCSQHVALKQQICNLLQFRFEQHFLLV